MDKIIEFLLQVLTVDQWKALGFLVAISSGVTETAKRAFLLRSNAVTRKRVSYIVAFVTGVAAGLVGWGMVGYRFELY